MKASQLLVRQQGRIEVPFQAIVQDVRKRGALMIAVIDAIMAHVSSEECALFPATTDWLTPRDEERHCEIHATLRRALLRLSMFGGRGDMFERGLSDLAPILREHADDDLRIARRLETVAPASALEHIGDRMATSYASALSANTTL